MLCSVFTPTHNGAFLGDVYQSLCNQTHRDWEWILVPNAMKGEIPARVREDPRVKVFPVDNLDGVGALKRFACEQSKGEVLVELDHDDMLIPSALARINEAVEEGAGFVHSDCAEFFIDKDGEIKPFTYSELYGWETYEFWLYGRPMLATKAFYHSARSMCEILFAPNHVRAWSKETYWKAGGHAAAIALGDDHDLVCRTYLGDARFRLIPEPLYLYRRHPKNTSTTRSAEIWKQQLENKDRFMRPLIDRWCQRVRAAKIQINNPKTAAWEEAYRQVEGYPVGLVTLNVPWESLDEKSQLGQFIEAWELLCPGGWLLVHAESETDIWTPHGFQRVHRQVVDDRVWMFFNALKGQRQPGWVED